MGDNRCTPGPVESNERSWTSGPCGHDVDGGSHTAESHDAAEDRVPRNPQQTVFAPLGNHTPHNEGPEKATAPRAHIYFLTFSTFSMLHHGTAHPRTLISCSKSRRITEGHRRGASTNKPVTSRLWHPCWDSQAPMWPRSVPARTDFEIRRDRTPGFCQGLADTFRRSRQRVGCLEMEVRCLEKGGVSQELSARPLTTSCTECCTCNELSTLTPSVLTHLDVSHGYTRG